MARALKSFFLLTLLALCVVGSTVAAADIDWLHAEDISEMPPTTIRFWLGDTPELIELQREWAQQFMAMYPNITVEVRPEPPNTDAEMLLPFIRTRTHSHVHQSVNNEDLWYIDRDLLLPLNDLPGFDELWSRLNPRLNYRWIDGNVYSLSWHHTPMLHYYNTKLVREAGLDPANAPKTYDEYLEWAARLTRVDANGNTVQWFIAPWLEEAWWAWEFMTFPFYPGATGTNEYISKDGTRATFNTPQGVKPYELYHELFSKGYAARTSFSADPFYTGQIAASLGGTWTIAEAARNAPPDFEYFVGPVPKPADSPVPADEFPTYSFVRSFAIVKEIGVSQQEQDRIHRAAWEFLKFMLTEEKMKENYQVSGSLPTAADLETNPVFASVTDQFGPQMWDAIRWSRQGVITDMNTTLEVEVMDYLQQAWLRVIYGRQSPADAVAQAEREVNQLLARGRR